MLLVAIAELQGNVARVARADGVRRGGVVMVALVIAACAERRGEIASTSSSACTDTTASACASAVTSTPALTPTPTSTPTLTLTPTPLPPDHWCTETLSALDDSTCYVVPDHLASPRSLVIYLHGVIAPTGRTQRVYQQIVANRARARGFVALMPRGRRGIGPKNIKDWWAWPTSADAHLRYGKELMASWNDEKRRLEEILGAPFERTYLAGSSNGAYFVAILALKGEYIADGFGAMSGGNAAGRSKDTIARAPRPPFYVGWGGQDDTHDDPKSLAALLVQAGWPSKSAEHPVGHGAREVYLDEAFDFWTSH